MRRIGTNKIIPEDVYKPEGDKAGANDIATKMVAFSTSDGIMIKNM
jgi:hypothetical protein